MSDEWKDISTAPKDGTTIVACSGQKGRNGATLIFWEDGWGWCGKTADDERKMVKYLPRYWLIALPTPPEDTQ